jgi:predicted DsbA family dithiol-disulfide isomerase
MDQRSYRDAVDRDWHRSRQLGVTAVPTFDLNGQRLVGAQSYAALEEMAMSAGTIRRSS